MLHASFQPNGEARVSASPTVQRRMLKQQQSVSAEAGPPAWDSQTRVRAVSPRTFLVTAPAMELDAPGQMLLRDQKWP